jgi:hypothetical protein
VARVGDNRVISFSEAVDASIDAAVFLDLTEGNENAS